MPDITLRQFAPILGAMLKVQSNYERAANEHIAANRPAQAQEAFLQAQAIDDAIKAAIDAATTGERP